MSRLGLAYPLLRPNEGLTESAGTAVAPPFVSEAEGPATSLLHAAARSPAVTMANRDLVIPE